MQCPDSWDGIVNAIFEKQRELMAQYKEIEQLPNPPISLHTKHGQRIMRDFAWRVTEELAETHLELLKEGTTAKDLALLELADATHFMVELLIFAGISASSCLQNLQRFPRPLNTMSLAPIFWGIVYSLGIAMNFLKNKAWKRSQVPTNEEQFRAALRMAFSKLIQGWSTLGYSQEDLYNYYFRKAEVNISRIHGSY